MNSSVLSPLLFPSNPRVCPMNEEGKERTKLSMPAVFENKQPTPFENVAVIVSFSFLDISACMSPLLVLYVPLT